jgi:diadenylate cyclase
MIALRLFFVPIRLTDVIEIAIVAFILYQLYRLLRGTVGMQILLGLMALIILDNVVNAMNMRVMSAIFGTVGDVFVLAIIILFQPEIRRVLSLVIGQNPLMRRLMGSSQQGKALEEVVRAATQLSRIRVGALIAFERSSGLRAFIETGAVLNATVSRDLLAAIFNTKSPLHDGAVIIQGGTLAAARCILPVSESKKLSPHLGLRHRAAVGLTEQSDAFVVVVSEERGTISVAENGVLSTNLSESEFRERLERALSDAPLPSTPLSTSGEA